jgi:hypothetical protein
MTDKRVPAVQPGDIMDALMGGEAGWSNLNRRDPMLPVNSVVKGDYDRMAEIAEAVFSGDRAQELLDFLMDQTVRCATWPGDLGASDSDILKYGCYREGQNSMTVLLCALIGRGRQLLEQGDHDHD